MIAPFRAMSSAGSIRHLSNASPYFVARDEPTPSATSLSLITTGGASMAEQDLMPIRNWDHIEFYVGNAKQAAHYYATTFGFTPVAYAGLETGVRDRASYVLEQGKIRFVLTSGLTADSPIAQHCLAHGDGAKVIALEVPDAEVAWRNACDRGAKSAFEPMVADDEYG